MKKRSSRAPIRWEVDETTPPQIGFRVPSGANRYHASSAGILKAILTCTLFLVGACNRSPQPTANPQSSDTAKANSGAEARQPELPDCGLPPEKLESSKVNGHHRVVLTWNPSSSSSGPNDQSVGYCLYRSGKDDITAKDLNHCYNCKRLNRRPIVGAGCVDNHVKDGATYHYVAGAIRISTRVNLFSNKMTAVIPSNAQSPHADTPYPLCEADNPPPTATEGTNSK